MKIRTAEESFGQRAMAGPAGAIDARWSRFTSRMSPLTEEAKARLAGMRVLKSRGDQWRGAVDGVPINDLCKLSSWRITGEV